jgi:type IV pilus assembly protein PilA
MLAQPCSAPTRCGAPRGRSRDDRGFTLIEMLVVVVIIGILAGIAIPLYLNYRKGAENKSAESDVRGAISAVEQFYTDNANTYPATQVGTRSTNMVLDLAGGGGATQTITVSSGNTLSYRNVTTYYIICGQNVDGAKIYVYNSSSGIPLGKSTRASLAACVAYGN